MLIKLACSSNILLSTNTLMEASSSSYHIYGVEAMYVFKELVGMHIGGNSGKIGGIGGHIKNDQRNS